MSVPRISYARGAGGVSLAFTVCGEGPPLVFVPAVPFSNLRLEWQQPAMNRVYERLTRTLTLVHYDGRGTGHSQRDVTDLSLEAMVADLAAVIDTAGLAEVSLLGQYNSCPHAIAYAAANPGRVRRMALFSGTARGWNAMSARPTQALLSLIEQDWDLFADTAAHQWLGWSAGETGRDVAEIFRSAVTPQVARATMQAASAVDVTDLLPQVTAPALVLHPRDMPQIPLSAARDLATGLPHGRLVELDGALPVLFGAEPDAVIGILSDFFGDGKAPPVTAPPAATAPRATMPEALSPRELEVLRLVAGGDSNAQIARRLGLSTHTIERHVANMYRKIGARGRADATAYALRNSLA